ncbi:MAG TPA: hypothetical protein VML54_11535, partial [Candidatus Limnocylindrales bacterium]|nr:hypothetical protein [Candidatus Limnocylindrales bacterium]
PSGRASGNVDGAPSVVSFAATPDRGPSVLAWSVAGATSVAITGAPGPFTAPTGTKDVSPVVATQYTLTATTASGPRTGSVTVQSCVPSVTIRRSASSVRPGQALTIGIEARNPEGCAEAELYTGVLLPDGATALFFSAPGVIGGSSSLATPNRFLPITSLAAGATFNAANLFSITLPPAGIVPGTYQLFGAFVRVSALGDNRIDAGDLLILDLQPLTVLP